MGSLQGKGLSLAWIALFLAVSCSVNFTPANKGGAGPYRGILKPNSAFEIYALKYPSLAASDQVAVTYGELTEYCHWSGAQQGNSVSEVSFVCSDSLDDQGRGLFTEPTSNQKSYLWLGKGKRPTHLWVNRVLYACRVESNQYSLDCTTASAVRNVTSQTN